MCSPPMRPGLRNATAESAERAQFTHEEEPPQGELVWSKGWAMVPSLVGTQRIDVLAPWTVAGGDSAP